MSDAAFDVRDYDARDRLVACDVHGDQDTVRFAPRARLAAIVAPGSCGLMLTVPLASFLFTESLAPRAIVVVAFLMLAGVALLELAVRGALDRPVITLNARELTVARGPLPPTRRHTWQLGDVAALGVTRRTLGPFDTERVRGFQVEHSRTIVVIGKDGAGVSLPARLSVRDADAVVAFLRERVTARRVLKHRRRSCCLRAGPP